MDNYRRLEAAQPNSEAERHAARQFKLDVQQHIKDISSKYILPGETAAGALMFVPAEAVFATIHAQF